MIFTRELIEKYNVDVFIAGGGPAGVAAAYGAAKMGKTVFLAEKNGSFGGMGTTGLVACFCTFTDNLNFLAGGFGKEVHDAIFGEDQALKYGFFPYPVEKLKKLYDDMMVKAGIKFSFFTTLVDVEAKDGRVESVILAAKSGLFAVKAKIYIDCTGDGDLSAWAGAVTEFGDENGVAMPATLCSLWDGIDSQKPRVSQASLLDKAYQDGIFRVDDPQITGLIESESERSIRGGNIGHCFEVDARDEISLTQAMLWGRTNMLEYERYYREYLGGRYENMYLCYTADVLGVRESRRVIGDYVLCKQDYIDRSVFDDEIGRYSYPIDIHAMSPGKEAFEAHVNQFKVRYGVGESYGIPYRTLVPKGLSNVLTAGRCVSTDHSMQASIRVMPGCFITGQAAGVAAALAAEKEETRSIKISELQEKIVSIGGYIPNRV